MGIRSSLEELKGISLFLSLSFLLLLMRPDNIWLSDLEEFSDATMIHVRERERGRERGRERERERKRK